MVNRLLTAVTIPCRLPCLIAYRLAPVTFNS